MRFLLAVAIVFVSLPAFGQWTANLQKTVEPHIKPAQEVPAQGGTLPMRNLEVSDKLEIVQLDSFERDGDDFIAEGDVHVNYRGYQIFGDRIVGSLKTEIFRIEGNAKVIGVTEELEGEVLEVDFKHDTFLFREASSIIRPDRLQNKLLDPLYVSGARGSGDKTQQEYIDGSFTTCELDHPHFNLKADRISVLSGRYAILRDVRVQVLGKTVLTLPYLSVPLNENSRRYTPEIGQSQDEGYFIKSKFTTMLPGQSFLDTRLDYMTKLGLGTGFDYIYRNSYLQGKTSLYKIWGQSDSMYGQAQHRHRLGKGELSLDANYNRNNYLTSPGITSLNARAQYSLPWGRGQSNFGFAHSGTESNGFSSKYETFTFGDFRQITDSLRTSLDLNLSSNESSSNGVVNSKAERLDVRFQGTQDMRSLTADLLYQRSIPVSSTENFFRGSDRTPLLTLRSTSQRLFGNEFGRKLPFNTEFSIGQLSDFSTEPITRTNFDFNFRRTEGSARSKHRLDWGGRFNQGLYSDDTAQYVLAYDGRYTYNFARNSSFNLNYRNLRQFGYTPLAIDRTGRSDVFNADLTYRPNEKWLFAAQTGYDILQTLRSDVPWQIITLRSEYMPRRDMRVSAYSVYDTYNQVWGISRLESQFRLAGADVALGVQYDGRRSTWAGGTLQITGLKAGRFTLSSLLSYNGYTQQMEAQHYSLKYDMHCTEAVLEFIDNRVGFRSGTQIAFFIRIKALPFSNPFGVGQRGQAIGNSGGFGR